ASATSRFSTQRPWKIDPARWCSARKSIGRTSEASAEGVTRKTATQLARTATEGRLRAAARGVERSGRETWARERRASGLIIALLFLDPAEKGSRHSKGARTGIPQVRPRKGYPLF